MSPGRLKIQGQLWIPKICINDMKFYTYTNKLFKKSRNNKYNWDVTRRNTLHNIYNDSNLKFTNLYLTPVEIALDVNLYNSMEFLFW